MLNKAKGNMFQFVECTWNPLGGKCPHACGYCYAMDKPFTLHEKYQGRPRLHKPSLNDDLSKYNTYFVANMTDLFAEKVPQPAIRKILNHCKRWEENTYLFLTKNPNRYKHFIDDLPKNSILGTTIETNRLYPNTTAPTPMKRMLDLHHINGFKKMISFEPIMEFDIDVLKRFTTKLLNLSFIAIGADSKNNGLREPTKEKTIELIKSFKKAEIPTHIKNNIKRLIGKETIDELHDEIKMSSI